MQHLIVFSIILGLIAVFFCACVRVPEYCSDGNKCDPETQFCYYGKAYTKCGVVEYIPGAEFCYGDMAYKKCGGKIFDPGAQVCVNGELEARITKFTVSFDTDSTRAPAYILPVTADSGAFFVAYIPDTPTKNGYDFLGWFDEANAKFTMLTVITKAANLTARWAEIPKYTVAYNGNGNTGGAAPVDNGSPYLSGSLVTVRAPGVLAKNGYKFCGWNTSEYEIGASYAAGNLLEIRENVTLYAKWTNGAINTYTVEVLSPGLGASGSSSYAAGATVAITTGTPPPGQRFKNWAATDGNIIFDNANRTATSLTMPASAVTVTANFGEIPKYAVTVSSPGRNAFGNGNYAVGDTVTITAGTPPIGRLFIGWTVTSGGGNVTLANPNSPVTTFTMPENPVSVTAEFEAAAVYTVTVSSTGNGATFSGSYEVGETVTVTAGTADGGRRFTNWTVASGGATLANPNSATTTFIMPGNDVAVTAVFDGAGNGGGGGDVTKETFSDSRDGKLYKTVKIGSQTWMAENLNYQTSSGSWCYENSADSCNKYGRLYDWATAMNIGSSYNSGTWGGSDANHQGVCPTGWHLPSRAEWDVLSDLAGDSKQVNWTSGSDTGYYWPGAGEKLKSTRGWYNNGNGTDEFGFSALPGGFRFSDGNFFDAGYYGYWWTATEYDGSSAYSRGMDYYYDYVYEYGYDKSYGFSVRCRRD